MNSQTITGIDYTEPANATAVGENSSPVVITVSTDVDNAERAQYFAIIELSAPTVTTYLRFNITFPITYDIRFYAKDILDGESFYTSAAEPTVSLNLDRIGQIITSNPTLNTLYSVEKISNTQLKVTSRKPGTQYNLSGVMTASTGLSITYSNFTSDATPGEGQKISDLYFFVDLYGAANASTAGDVFVTPNTNTFLSIDKLRKPYTQDNSVSFDLAPALNTFLNRVENTNRPTGIYTNAFELLDFYSNDSIHWRCNIGVSYSRATSDVSVEQVYASITGKKSYHAALPLDVKNDFSEYLTVIPNGEGVKVRSLKESPIVKRNEYVTLHFYVTATYTSMEARVFTCFEDGTDNGSEGVASTYEIVQQVISPYKNLYTYMFKVDEIVARAEAVAGKRAKRFNVIICANGGSTRITAEKRYIIDNKTYEFERSILYQNSVGGYDSFVFTGQSELDGDVDRTFYVDTNLIGYRPGDKYNATQAVTFTPTRRLSSNYLDKIQYQDLKELVKSKNVYELAPYEQNVVYEPGNNTIYSIDSCDMLPEGSGSTWYTSGTSGTSGADCYRFVNIDSSPTTSTRLYVYDEYAGGSMIYERTNNFILRVGRIRSTAYNGATDLGTLTVDYRDTSNNVIRTDTVKLTSVFQYHYFYFNEESAADEIRLRVEAINSGDDYVIVEFHPNEGLVVQPLDVQWKYLRITADDYRESDSDDLKDLTITVVDTVSESNL